MADIADFFENTLPKKLQENPDLASDINASYVIDVDGAGKWSVDLTSAPGSVSAGAMDDPGCLVEVPAKDFGAILDNPAQIMAVFISGNLKVSNMALAMSLQKILS